MIIFAESVLPHTDKTTSRGAKDFSHALGEPPKHTNIFWLSADHRLFSMAFINTKKLFDVAHKNVYSRMQT